MKINKKKVKIVNVIVLSIVIILSNFIQILFLSLADVKIIDFRCDAREIGDRRYKADVGENINFIFDAEDYGDVYVIMGDGEVIYDISGSTFSHTYTKEGIFNATLWAVGPGGPVSDWLVLEIINDAPEFEIGYTSVEYHEATYDFEDQEIGDYPDDWNIFNNDLDFYLNDLTHLNYGSTVRGGIENLTIEDDVSWKIQSELIGTDHKFIEISLNFQEEGDHVLTPGQYEFYFSANDTISLIGYNPNLKEDEILFSDSYSFGKIITILRPQSLKLFTSYYIEDLGIDPGIIAIDWFKLIRLDKGVEIIKDEHDHGNIIKMSFGESSQYCGISQNFPLQTHGTIEFWYRTTDTKIGAKIYSISENFGIIQKNNKWYASSNDITLPQFGNVPAPTNNTWFHIRIDWQGHFAGQYEELGYELYRVHINGYPSTIFNMPSGASGINSIYFETNGTIFIDAIGYYWDPEYNLGDNIKAIHPEHIYEDIEMKFSLINLEESEIDQKGFSYNLDSEVGKNFSYIWDFGDGNYSNDESPTHKFIEAGEYPVRLTLIDDQGAMTSVVKDFIIENKNPESSILHGLNYDVTYDFKYDLSDKPPSDWITHGNVKVIDYKDEFSKVVEIDNTVGGYGSIKIPDPPIGNNGSIEFWIYFTDINNDEFFFWFDKLESLEANILPLKNSTRFGFLDGRWMYYYTFKGPMNINEYAYAEMTELTIPSNNEWTHIRIDYCWSDKVNYKGLSGNQWRIYINGNASNIYNGVGKNFKRKGLDIRAGSHIYLESFGFTNDPNYYLGDNNPRRLKTYYATWDFRFYPIGPIPYDNVLEASVLGPWMFGSYNFERFAKNCSASILPELDDHYKVLELQDNNDTDLVFASLLDFQNSKYGTLEFWLRTTDTSQGLVMALGYEVFHSAIWLGNNGEWWYKEGEDYTEISDVPRMLNNTWHHIRIDFDCRKNGGYLGLYKNEFNFWVDGYLSNLGPFNFNYDVSNFAWNIWSTEKEGANYSIFLDAIGASWDPAYQVGDNKFTREAIYCDTEIIFSADFSDTPTDENSLRYLWHFGDNQTGFGQTVLHTFGRAGKYKVKLITIDDNGGYDITEKFIWIDNLYPEVNISRINYGRTTFDFSDDDIGTFPNGWYKSALEYLYGNITFVIDEVDGFHNVVQIGNGTGLGGIWTYNCSGIPFDQTEPGDLNLTYGTIEFWLYVNDTSKSNIYISLFQDTYLDGIFIEFNNGTWEHNNEEIIFENLWELQNKTWTHFRVDFCCDDSNYMGLENDTFIIYAEEYTSQVLSMSYSAQVDILNITCFGIFTKMNNVETTPVFVDNFGFSWDPEYDVGDNKFLLIQYEFNEGETILLESLSTDTLIDYQQLVYNWGNLYLDITEWEDLGWYFSYAFTNNDDGDELEGYPIVSFVGDPLYMWDVDTYYLKVNNILPELNINSVSVITNISASISNTGLEGANFTITLSSDNVEYTTETVYYPSNFLENSINFNLFNVSMDLSKNWSISINQTQSEGGVHNFTLIFQYKNGLKITKSEDFDSIGQLWFVDINEMWINSIDNLSNVPLTFGATMTDPSDDKIDLRISHIINTTYEISGVGSTYTKNFTIVHEPYDVFCQLKVIEENSRFYAVVMFQEQVENNWWDDLISGSFPVSYDLEFTADMTDIEIFTFINDIFNDEGFTNLGYINKKHWILAEFNEILPLSEVQKIYLNYNITSKFNFGNLDPLIEIRSPTNVTEDQLFTVFTDVSDFNKDNLTVSFSNGINNGDGLIYEQGIFNGNKTYSYNYTYKNAGKYLLRVRVSDGFKTSEAIKLIQVFNSIPYAKIRFYQNITYEDQIFNLEADIYDTESDIKDLRFYWDFGDGCFSSEINPSHSYYKAGTYTIRLNLKDDNGATYCDVQQITVIEQPPQILGPFSFIGVEGQSTILDVELVDSASDSFMDLTWDIYKGIKFYNGTFTFMDVNDGDIPIDPRFEFNNIPDIQYMVKDEISLHRKVLGIFDESNTSAGYWSLTYGDSTSVNGTIEFWLRSSYIMPSSENFKISLFNGGSSTTPITIFDNGTWFYSNIYTSNDTEINNVPRLSSNIWCHIRIDYECSEGGYLGLGENEWRLMIDGASSPNLPMQFGSSPYDDVGFLDTLQITSGNQGVMNLYCDAISFHNQFTQYQIGDNFERTVQSQEYVKTVYGKKPSLTLGNGLYIINLAVENDAIAQAEITLEIFSVAPFITVPSKYYSGHTGSIDITAYAWDSYVDKEILEFEWFINGERILLESGDLKSTIKVLCTSTETLKGHVIVRDDTDLIDSEEFFVDIFKDSNGNGFSNEYDKLFVGNPIDADGDGLPNTYETSITNTDPDDSDTDNDGLLDGWNMGDYVGEMSIGTLSLINDTDSDGLVDGDEFFGWNHSVFTDLGYQILNYTSNPKIYDTDGDSLSDKEEYLYKTNPRSPDTDNDGFSDYIEIFEYGTNPNIGDIDKDGLLDRIEFEIGTNYNNSDTDGDGINDGDEFYGWEFKTNPLCQDTDHDFLPDNSETIDYIYKIDGRKSFLSDPEKKPAEKGIISEIVSTITSIVTPRISKPVILKFGKANIEKAASAQISFLLTYGETAQNNSLSDFQVVIYKQDSELVLVNKIFYTNGTNRYFFNATNIKSLIESAGESYYGFYIFKVIYFNAIHADLCLEEFSISVSKYLDPNLNDYDYDGIMDGVETQLLVEGKDITEYPNYNNITADMDPDTNDIYHLEISDIGVAYHPKINFTIVSNKTLLGDGHVLVKVIQKQLDLRVEDRIIFISNITFSNSEDFLKQFSVKPSSFYPYKYYGKYEVIIDVYGDNSNDTFNIINIAIEKEGYRNANPTDTQAWITKPDCWDSDDDGWSDYYEIYGRGEEATNPLEWDTDRDGIKDSMDFNPLYNILIEIKFDEGSIHNLKANYVEKKNPPKLQLVVQFKYEGKKWAYISTHRRCTEDQRSIKYYIPYTTIEYKPRLYYDTTANFYHKYYVEIEDDVESLDLTFSLWDEYIGKTDEYGDNLLLTYDYTHNLATNPLDVSHEIYGESGGSWFRARVTTRALRHAPTIAIFDNSTLFNGHYNTQSRMHMIQVNVTNTPPPSSPFIQGLNTILIPGDILIKTKLNSILQNSTSLKTSVLAKGEFMSLDRNNLPESSSNSIETVFLINCTYIEAKEILDLALSGVVNETSEELIEINLFACTKLDGFIPEMMNLAPDVLELIAIINPYHNSRQGSVPEQREDIPMWLEIMQKGWDTFVGFLVGVVQAFAEFVVKVAKLVWEAFVNIVKAAAAVIAWLIELIVKAAILLIIIAAFGFTLLLNEASFLSVLPLVKAISKARNLDLSITSNSYSLKGQSNFKYQFKITSIYIKFLDLDIPCLKEIYSNDNSKYTTRYHFFTSSIPGLPSDFFDGLNNSQFNSIIPEGTEEDFYQGAGDVMSFIGYKMTIEAALNIINSDKSKKGLTVITLKIARISLMYLQSEIVKRLIYENQFSKKYVRGMVAGGLIASFFNIIALALTKAGPLPKWAKYLLKTPLSAYLITNLAEKVLSYIWGEDNILGPFVLKNLVEYPDFIKGFIVLTSGLIMLWYAPDRELVRDTAQHMIKMALMYPILIYMATLFL